MTGVQTCALRSQDIDGIKRKIVSDIVWSRGTASQEKTKSVRQYYPTGTTPRPPLDLSGKLSGFVNTPVPPPNDQDLRPIMGTNIKGKVLDSMISGIARPGTRVMLGTNGKYYVSTTKDDLGLFSQYTEYNTPQDVLQAVSSGTSVIGVVNQWVSQNPSTQTNIAQPERIDFNTLQDGDTFFHNGNTYKVEIHGDSKYVVTPNGNKKFMTKTKFDQTFNGVVAPSIE